MGVRIIICFLYSVAFTIGEVIPMKPSKVVAGHEPERTNEFLQLLGTAIIRKAS